MYVDTYVIQAKNSRIKPVKFHCTCHHQHDKPDNPAQLKPSKWTTTFTSICCPALLSA